MPDMQQLLDRGFTTGEIRRMCGAFRVLAPKARINLTPQLLLKAPVLDNCNH